MKRSRDSEYFQPRKRFHIERPILKRKNEGTYGPNKRSRVDEAEALHRMLTEAYARIAQLEQRLKELKFMQEYNCRQMNHQMYNHGIQVH